MSAHSEPEGLKTPIEKLTEARPLNLDALARELSKTQKLDAS